MKLSRHLLSATMIALCCVGPAIAQDTGRTVRTTSRTITETATVNSVDVPNRTVVLSEPGGKTVSVKVERVKNLPQLQMGDQVIVKYHEAIAVRLHKSGLEPGASVLEGTSTAKPGEKPGAVGTRQVTVIAPIAAIDKTKPSVTLRGADGNLVEAEVKNPANLKDVNVGDNVEITYTEAVAVSVMTPQKTKSGAGKSTTQDLNKEELNRIREGG